MIPLGPDPIGIIFQEKAVYSLGNNLFPTIMEYQKNEVSEDEVEKLYFYLCRTLFYGMEDPSRTIGEIIDWI